jgi:disulfide bond formation protein DsbB
MKTQHVAIVAGCVSLGLILGALGFQYLGNLPPCEMCHWQRWPHIGAAIVGILGGACLLRSPAQSALPLAIFTLLLVAASGAIGAYQAGVEWGFLPGPAACTGGPIYLTGNMDLNHPVVRCDIAAFRLFGISLAGYNALISFVTAIAGAWLLRGAANSKG